MFAALSNAFAGTLGTFGTVGAFGVSGVTAVSGTLGDGAGCWELPVTELIADESSEEIRGTTSGIACSGGISCVKFGTAGASGTVGATGVAADKEFTAESTACCAFWAACSAFCAAATAPLVTAGSTGIPAFVSS